MNNQPNPSAVMEPIEDRIDILFRELELAIKWQRPSILFAIYSSEYVRSDAESVLENRLIDIGQEVLHYQVANSADANITAQIAQILNLEQSIFFIDGLRWGGADGQAYTLLNKSREYFVDKRIRIVFWLSENEAIDLAHYAPDYWAFRHRVIEFVDSPRPEQILVRALESAWQGTGEFSDALEDTDAKISLRESLLTDLPEGEESTSMRANLLLTLGVLHWRKGNYEKATGFLQTAREAAGVMNDQWFEAECFNALALVKTSMGRIDDAIEAYRQAIHLAPGQIFPWNNLGNLYSKLDRSTEALAAFQKAIERNPDDPVSWNGLGNVYWKLERFDEALIAYQRALEIEPTFVLPLIGLGNAYVALEKFEEAIAFFQKALDHDARMVAAWIGLGNLMKDQGRADEAINAYRRGLGIDPRNAHVWNDLGNVYFGIGAYEDAIAAYNNAIELDRAFGRFANLALAYTYSAAGEKGPADIIPQIAEAIEPEIVVTEIAEAEPISVEVLETETISVEDAEPQAQAEPEMIAAPVVEEKPAPPSAMHNAHEFNRQGNDRLKDGNYSEAIEAFAKAIDLNPEYGWPYSNLALAYARQGQNDRAIALYQKSLALLRSVQEKAIVWNRLGDAYRSARDYSKAMAAYQRADELFADGAPCADMPEAAADESHAEPLDVGRIGNPTHAEPLDEDQIVNPTYSTPEGNETMNTTVDRDIDETIAAPPEPETPEYGYEIRLGEIHSEAAPETDAETHSAEAWNEIGNQHTRAGEYDNAISAYIKAIETDPKFGWAYSNLALVYTYKGKYPEAVLLYQKSVDLLNGKKEKAVSWNRLGDAYRRMNNRARALDAYQQAVELDPDENSLLTRARFILLSNSTAA
jgi:tetratricopeptide (TPR) repeat protein